MATVATEDGRAQSRHGKMAELKSGSLTYGPVWVLASATTVVPLPLPAQKLRSVSWAPVQP